jgi:hypothetical protein
VIERAVDIRQSIAADARTQVKAPREVDHCGRLCKSATAKR